MRFLIFLTFIFVISRRIYAAPIARLACNSLDAEQCKAEFQKLFRAELKSEFFDSLKEVLNLVRTPINAAIANLQPQEKYLKSILEDNLREMQRVEARFNDSFDDYDKFMSELKEFAKNLAQLGPNEKPTREDSGELSPNDKNLLDNVFNAGFETSENIFKKWKELYDGLRDIDFQQYPEYKDIYGDIEAYDNSPNKKKEGKKVNAIFLKMIEFLDMPEWRFII